MENSQKTTKSSVGVFRWSSLTAGTLRKDGSEFPVELSLSPLESEDGFFVSTAFRDVSERKHIEELRTGLEFEKLLSEISETLINLSSVSVDGEIENCLKLLVEGFDTDRAFLAEVDIPTKTLLITHKWDRPGIPHSTDAVVTDAVVKDMFPWLHERVSEGKILCLSRPEELPEEASVEFEHMMSTGVKSSIVIPLLIGGNLVGALSMASFRKQKTWDSVVITRFQQAGNVFANALARKHSDEKLKAAYLQISDLKERLEQENTYLREEIKLKHNHS
ncbi:MAG: PAS domain S-box protein, partial [Acidobacteria bacterium]|nr:PAS domain S-box protein [Acidobacteriota bacterium]